MSSPLGRREVLSRRPLMIRSRAPEVLSTEQRRAMLARRRAYIERFRQQRPSVPSSPPSSSSSSSSSSSTSTDSDDFQPPHIPDFNPSTFEREVTAYICNRSGVMHFPTSIGKQIPKFLGRIILRDNHSGRIYNCSITTASRSEDEKYLAGQEWRDFVKEQRLKIGDVLNMRIRASPPTLFVDIVRA